MSSLQDVCCITSDGDFFVPSKETIMEKRLVVSTLITAGRLLLIKCYVNLHFSWAICFASYSQSTYNISVGISILNKHLMVETFHL